MDYNSVYCEPIDKDNTLVVRYDDKTKSEMNPAGLYCVEVVSKVAIDPEEPSKGIETITSVIGYITHDDYINGVSRPAISDDKKRVAILTVFADRYRATSMFDIETHERIPSDKLDSEFEEKFNGVFTFGTSTSSEPISKARGRV